MTRQVCGCRGLLRKTLRQGDNRAADRTAHACEARHVLRKAAARVRGASRVQHWRRRWSSHAYYGGRMKRVCSITCALLLGVGAAGPAVCQGAAIAAATEPSAAAAKVRLL